MLRANELVVFLLFFFSFSSFSFAYRQSKSFEEYVLKKANCVTESGEPWGLLFVANGCYFDVSINLLLDLKYTHDTNCVLLFTDKEGVDMLEREDLGIEAYDYNAIYLPTDVNLGYKPRIFRAYTPPKPFMKHYHSRYKTPNTSSHNFPRWPIWMLRHSITLSALELGVGIFQSDVDIVFLKPPSSFIRGNFDIQGETQAMSPVWKQLPPKNDMNLGFGFVRPSHRGVLHWRVVNAMMRYRGLDPQSADNLMLFGAFNDGGVFNQTEEGVAIFSPMVTGLWWNLDRGAYFHPAGLKNNKYNDMSKYLRIHKRWFLTKEYRSHQCG